MGAPIATTRFEIVRRVGAGGCGEVHEARDRQRGGVVALKTLPRIEPRALFRFKREFRALADVSHPSLLPLYELLEEDGTWMFTMELVEGAADFLAWVRGSHAPRASSEVVTRSLSDAPTVDAPTADARNDDATLPAGGALASEASARQRPALGLLDVDRLRDALRELVLGVSALHAHGLVHRDLKPSNVLVDRAGRVRVLDFGLVAERSGGEQGIAGTPVYMSPEQAAGRPVDAESDWYAVGVMLYEALTGQLPHDGPPLKVIVDKQRVDPAPVRELAPDVDPALERLCAWLLARDPKARPTGAQILALLGTPEVRRRSLPPEPSVLVGRERELDALADALDEASSGAGVVVRVAGASGAGKSLLVARFLESIAGSACVLSARCFERETVPYAALDGIVDAIAERIARLDRARRPAEDHIAPVAAVFPVLGAAPSLPTSDPRELRRAAARGLASLAETAAGGRPLVFVIDDAHWGDGDSVPFVLELAKLRRALLLLVHRDEATSPLLVGLRDASLLRSAREIVLGPLDASAVLELVTRLGGQGADAGARAERIAEESRGNAMLAFELAARTRLSREPASLDRLIEERVGELSPPARALLEIACVAGGPIDRTVAERAAGIEGHAVAAERALTTERLARFTGERDAQKLAPYHDRIRETTTALLAPDALAARNASIAGAFEASGGGTAEVLSHHWHAAGQHERAVPYTLLAARRAADALAFDRAAALFARVVEHTPDDHEELEERLVALGDALRNAGRGADAADAYLRAAERSELAAALELRRRAVEQLLRCGYVERGLEAMRALLRDLGIPARENRALAVASVFGNQFRLAVRGRGFTARGTDEVDPELLLRIDTCWAIGSGLALIDTVRGLDFFTRAVLLALEAGEPSRVARALAHDATFYVRKGPRTLPAGRAQIARARSIAAPLHDPVLNAIVTACEAISVFLCGLFPEAIALCDRAAAEGGSTLGLGWERETLHRTVLKSLYFTGGLARLASIVDPAMELAEERRDLYAEVSLRARAWYVARLRADEHEELHAALDASFAKWPGQGIFLQRFFELGARVDIDLYRGEGARAHDRVLAIWDRLRRSQLLRSHGMYTEAHYIRGRAAIAAGRLDDARKTAKRLAGSDAPWADGLGTLQLGLVEPSDERAIALLEHSERVLEGAGMMLLAAGARWRRGEITGGDEGRALVAEARQRFVDEGVRAPERMLEVFAPRR